MALTPTLTPSFTVANAAYRPIPYRFSSDISPDSTENPIVEIRVITAAEFGLNPELGEETVIVQIDNSGGGLGLTDGQHIKIEDSPAYTGIFQQIKEISTDHIAITAVYTVDEALLGQTIEKFYNNFSAVLKMKSSIAEVDTIAIFTTRIGFDFDVSELVATLINSSLSIGVSSDTALEVTSTYMKSLFFEFAEQYDIPDANGINELTRQVFSIDFNDAIVLNSAPKVIGFGYDFNDGLTNFEIKGVVGTQRFLTEQPAVTIGESDDYQLTFYTAAIADTLDMQFKYLYFDSSGSQVGLTTEAFNTSGEDTAYSVNVGTRLKPVLSSAAYYTVHIEVIAGPVILSEALRFNIDYECGLSDIRMFWLNNLGGFDAHTFKGHSSINTTSTDTSIFNANTEPTIDIQNDAEFRTVFKDLTEVETANSGLVTGEVANWLMGIVKSTQVYMERDNVIVPVILQTNSAQGANTQEKKTSINIAFKIAYKELTING